MLSLSSISKYTLVASILIAIYFALFPGRIVSITIILSYPLAFSLGTIIVRKRFPELENAIWFKLFFFYGLIVFIRGIIDAKSYQDWTTLLSGGVVITFLIPFVFYLGVNTQTAQIALKTFLIYIPFIFVLYFLTSNPGPYGFAHTLSPIYIFILFIPFLKRKMKLIVIVLVLLSFFRDISIRANMLNIIVAVFILTTYWFHNSIFVLRGMKLGRLVLIISPVLFSLLALFYGFNIFKISEEISDISISDSEGTKQEVFVDSRTGVYLDVINQLVNDKALIWGLGLSGKTETFLSDNKLQNFDSVYKEGRRGTEAGMLNYIQYGGLIGGLLYFMLFIRASYLAMYKSNNWFSKMLGLFMMYRGIFSFVEDRIGFSIGAIFIFIGLGMCFNSNIREMNNAQMKLFVAEVFNLKIIRLFKIA